MNDALKGKVAVVGDHEAMFGAVAAALATQGIEVERLASLSEPGDDLDMVDVIYAPGWMTVGKPVFERTLRLRGLVSPYTGVEGFDRAAASARGVLIANGQFDENVESMAEATLLMLLAAAYRLPAAIDAMRDGGWPARPMGGHARMIKAMTVGIVGYGRIAQALVRLLVPFGCRLLISAPTLRVALPEQATHVDLATLATNSDAVILLASLNNSSRHLADAAFLALLKPGAILVNSARGGLIDEAALARAMNDGAVGAVALDVFEREPLAADSPLRAQPHALLTPHAVGHTRETIQRMPAFALENILALLGNKRPLAVVNPEAIPAWQARFAEPVQ